MSPALALEPARLAALSTRFEDASAAEVLRWAVEGFEPGRLALVSAFGPTSSVILHLLQDIAPGLPVVFVDTLHHFPETLQHVENMRRRFGMNLRVYRPCATRAEFEARYGPRLWERDLDLYQQVSKVEPFRRATEGLDAWITGRRREQSETRCDLPVVEAGPRIKINPLAGWSRKDVWHHILAHELPYNPLHDRGYASIGDEPLTTPVHDGEHERAGRWRGLGKLECGIHLVDHAPEQAAAD